MTDLELNKIRNMITSYNLTSSDIKLMKGRWYKIYNKVFTDTFGIEIEMPYTAFVNRGNVEILEEKIIENITSKYYFEFIEKKYPKTSRTLIPRTVCDLGMDCRSREFRMCVTKNSLGLLDKVIREIQAIMSNEERIVYNLHVHIPIGHSLLNRNIFKTKIEDIQSVYNKYYREIEIILRYLLEEWRSDYLMDDFKLRFDINTLIRNFEERLTARRRGGPSIIRLIHNIQEDIPIQENGEFNTIEFRGMHTDISYEAIMKKVFLVSILNNLLFHGKADVKLIQEALLIIEND